MTLSPAFSVRAVDRRIGTGSSTPLITVGSKEHSPPAARGMAVRVAAISVSRPPTRISARATSSISSVSRAASRSMPLKGQEAAGVVFEQQPHVAEQRLEVRQVAERLAAPVGAEDETDVAIRFGKNVARGAAPSFQLVTPRLNR